MDIISNGYSAHKYPSESSHQKKEIIKRRLKKTMPLMCERFFSFHKRPVYVYCEDHTQKSAPSAELKAFPRWRK